MSGSEATQFKASGYSAEKADKFSALIETLSGVGGHTKILQERCEEQRLEIMVLNRQDDILRSENRRLKKDLNAALRGKDAPIALATDEQWLFHRNATLKFGLSADGRRILVMRCRGQKIVRLRDKIVRPGQVTDLLRQTLKIGRGRSYERGKTLGRRDRNKQKAYLVKRNEQVAKEQKEWEAINGSSRPGQEAETANQALARRQDRLTGDSA